MNTGESVHIERDPARCGGKPCIAGTRIRVWDVHVWHELRGWSPAEIITQFPQLSFADIYAALAYYHDHREEIEAQIRQDDEFVLQLKTQSGPSKLERLREQDIANVKVPPG